MCTQRLSPAATPGPPLAKPSVHGCRTPGWKIWQNMTAPFSLQPSTTSFQPCTCSGLYRPGALRAAGGGAGEGERVRVVQHAALQLALGRPPAAGRGGAPDVAAPGSRDVGALSHDQAAGGAALLVVQLVQVPGGLGAGGAALHMRGGVNGRRAH